MESASAKTWNGNPYHRFTCLQTADVCIYPYPTGLKTRGYSFSRLPDVSQLRSSFIAPLPPHHSPLTPSLLITHHSLLTAQKPVLMFFLYNKRRHYRVDGHPELVSGSVRGERQEKARGEMLKQVQHDIWSHLLFILSFWGSQFNSSVQSKISPLTTHRSPLTAHRYII